MHLDTHCDKETVYPNILTKHTHITLERESEMRMEREREKMDTCILTLSTNTFTHTSTTSQMRLVRLYIVPGLHMLGLRVGFGVGLGLHNI